MKYPSISLESLPELPLELFEQAGKLDYSERAPVLTVKPDKLTIDEPPADATSQLCAGSQIQVVIYHTWVTYPHVICHSWDDLEAVAALRLEENPDGPGPDVTDLSAVARNRRYYKLSRLHGRDLVTPWGCVVHYGPWFATIVEEPSCFCNVPSRWTLSVSGVDLDLVLEWEGTLDDIPSYPNLTVFTAGLVGIPQQPMCCPGFKWCHITQSCIPAGLNCKDPIPA